MMWGYGYGPMWGMMLNLLVFGIFGVILATALVWVTFWAVSCWRHTGSDRLERGDDARNRSAPLG
jgi:uncharacterized membrane protein